MPSTRQHTARKPVGSGSAFRPVPEYGPSAGQITSSPYVNAVPAAASDFSLDSKYDPSARRHSRESVNSDRFYDTEQQPELDGSAVTGVTTQTTSPTIAQAPALFPHNTPAHLYHRYDGSRQRDQLMGYQRLPSEGPEQTPQASQTPQGTQAPQVTQAPYGTSRGHHPWSQQEARISSTSSLPKAEQGSLRQYPAYQSYSTSRHGSPASEFSEHSTYALSMPDPSLPSPVVPEVPAHNSYSHSASAHHTSAPAHTIPSQNPAHYVHAPDYAQAGRQAKHEAYPHFKQPYLEGLDGVGSQDRSAWHSTLPLQPQHPPLPAKPPKSPASAKYGPSFPFGEPYQRDGSALDDDFADSPDRSLSPAQSISTERDSSVSLSSESAANMSSAPAAVSELPPGALYRRQVSTSARPRHGAPLTLASLANRNSSSDLSPRASGTQLDTPSSIMSYPPPPYASAGVPSESPISDHRSETASRGSRTSATSLSAVSQTSRAPRDTPVPPASESQRSAKPKDEKESLGIGIGSAYVQRVRVDAAETHISKVPSTLPIGLRARAKSPATHIQPEFLRKAMDIRYTHLPQRMLETEVDDDDVPLGQQQFPGTTAPPGVQPRVPTPPPVEYESLDPARRSHSPVESVMERTGKIKLFVANPDDESD